MKIVLSSWSWLNGRIIKIVHIQKRKDGCWTLNSQRKLEAMLRETKGVTVEEA